MSTLGQPERATQTRVIALFRDELGYPSERVHPPHETVRIAGPSADEIEHHPRLRDFAAGLGQTAAEKLQEQDREGPREYLDRESNYV